MKEVKPIEIKGIEDGQEIKNLEKVNGGVGDKAYVFCSLCGKSFEYVKESKDSINRAYMELGDHMVLMHP